MTWGPELPLPPEVDVRRMSCPDWITTGLLRVDCDRGEEIRSESFL